MTLQVLKIHNFFDSSRGVLKLHNPTKNFTCTHRQQEPVALMEVGTDDPEIPLPSFKSNLGGNIMMQCTVPSSALCHVCTTYYH